jgi:hypothetical protein
MLDLTRTLTRRFRPSRLAHIYCRLTLAFVVGLYLPAAFGAADLPRHFGEALHNWAALFFAPVAAWRLLGSVLWGAVEDGLAGANIAR